MSELGDKTFFIAAILAMRNNKLTVFLAAISALAVMTVLSALLGFVVTTFIPREYTYYTCTAIMFLFGENRTTMYGVIALGLRFFSNYSVSGRYLCSGCTYWNEIWYTDTS